MSACITWRCHLCQRNIKGIMSQSQHQRNFMKDSNDPTRCDNVIKARRAQNFLQDANDPAVTTCDPAGATSVDSSFGDAVQTATSVDSSFGDAVQTEVPLIQFPVGPVPPPSLRYLASRKGTSLGARRRRRMSYVLQSSTQADVSRPRNLVHVQDDWNRQSRALLSIIYIIYSYIIYIYIY